jgi:hypothetical protein
MLDADEPEQRRRREKTGERQEKEPAGVRFTPRDGHLQIRRALFDWTREPPPDSDEGRRAWRAARSPGRFCDLCATIPVRP